MRRPSTESLLLAAHLVLPLAVGWSLPTFVRAHVAGFHGPGHSTPPSWYLAGAVAWFAGIVAAYALDRLHPAARRQDRKSGPAREAFVGRHAAVLWGLALVACVSIVGAVSLAPRQLALPVLLLAALTGLHALLRRFLLVKVLVVALAWSWGAAALPLAPPAGWPHELTRSPLPIALLLVVMANVLLSGIAEATRETPPGALPAPLPAAAIAALAGAGLALHANAPSLASTALVLLALASRPQVLAREGVGPLVADLVLLIPGLATLLP